VRGWLRSFARRAEAVRRLAVRFTHELDPAPSSSASAGSPLAEALEALGSAARASRLHLRTRAGPWELAVVLSDGLLHGSST
jgi:hypothetical protein